MKDQYLFVYGTLRREGGGEMYHLLARHSDFVGEATYQGRLYLVSYYPGIIPSDDPSDIVYGEVYRLSNPSLVLARLDEYEECAPGFDMPTEYVRLCQEIRLSSGEMVCAWMYIYNLPTDAHERLLSGDFLGIGTR